MQINAKIDRFEDGKAVLIAAENKDEYIVPSASLIRGAIKGHLFLVKVEEDRIIDVVIDEKKPANVKERLAEKIARLIRGRHPE